MRRNLPSILAKHLLGPDHMTSWACSLLLPPSIQESGPPIANLVRPEFKAQLPQSPCCFLSIMKLSTYKLQPLKSGPFVCGCGECAACPVVRSTLQALGLSCSLSTSCSSSETLCTLVAGMDMSQLVLSVIACYYTGGLAEVWGCYCLPLDQLGYLFPSHGYLCKCFPLGPRSSCDFDPEVHFTGKAGGRGIE